MRHGETLWNAEGRLQGSLDAPLTARGRQQAMWQADLVSKIDGQRWSSPQGRAQRTAEVIFGTNGFLLDDRLSEIGIGTFAGQLLSDLQQARPHIFQGSPLDWYDHCPQGEGFAGLALRCRNFLNSLTGPALIVTHGMTLRMLRLIAQDMPLSRLAEGDMRQGVVHVIRRGCSNILDHHSDPD
ncbi:histidine phosphatase family protein [Paracoccus sp. (in: a-proteobacteria)]|uniref:histidine phosphatase family protein n=1 Tax=Paracoccus sp. TaxID=267 RepID=UPI00396CB369